MSRCTPGHGWTTRAKRRGGRLSIEKIRAEQYQKLARIFPDSRIGPTAKIAIEWLDGNPVRVLGRPILEALNLHR